MMTDQCRTFQVAIRLTMRVAQTMSEKVAGLMLKARNVNGSLSGPPPRPTCAPARTVQTPPNPPPLAAVMPSTVLAPVPASLDAAAGAQSAEGLTKWLVESCTSNMDFVNAAVPAQAVTAPWILGAERQKTIDTCTTEPTSHR